MSGSDNPRREGDDDDEATTTALLSQQPPKKQRRIIRMNDDDDDDNNNSEEEGVVGAAAAAAAGKEGGVEEEDKDEEDEDKEEGEGKGRGGGGGGGRGGIAPAAAAQEEGGAAATAAEEVGGGGKQAAATAAKKDPPEVYNGDAMAATVFTDPYYYMTPRAARKHEEDRLENLEGWSVRQALENFYNEAAKTEPPLQVHPLEALAKAIGARVDRIRAYYNTADMGTRTFFAGIVLKAKYKGDFQERTVTVGAALEPLLAPLTPAAAAEASTATATGTAASEPHGLGGESPPATTRAAAAAGGRTVNVGFLKDLRLAKEEERFLIPKSVYVRDCMKVIFGLFLEDVKDDAVPPKSNSTALIGSPGVGKSILFFLAALHQARKRMVVYFRFTKVRQEQVSLFFMMPMPEDATSVRVWFSRNVDIRAVKDNGGINKVSLDLESELDMRREEYYAYIDGPNHGDENNLMEGTYDYFCTSGGFPLHTNAEAGKRLWILDGWTQEEAIAGLKAVGRCDEAEAAEEIYWLCGGNIRDMLVACGAPQKVQAEIDLRINNLGDATMAMTLLSAERSADPSSPDRLRTMFLDKSSLKPKTKLEEPGDGAASWNDVVDAFEPELKSTSGVVAKRDVMHAYQIVDSVYALNKLTAKVSVSSSLDSYRLCLLLGMKSGAGSFFERLIHRVVADLEKKKKEKKKKKGEVEKLPVNEFCWSIGKAKESVKQLAKTGVYWIPSVANFASIDSALVHGHTLYLFQMTIADKHDFNVASFRNAFAGVVMNTFRANGDEINESKMVLYVVVPMGSNFNVDKNLNFTNGKNKVDKPKELECRLHPVDLSDPNSISDSIRELMEAIGREASQGRRPRSDDGPVALEGTDDQANEETDPQALHGDAGKASGAKVESG
jgi:hypothetical protein